MTAMVRNLREQVWEMLQEQAQYRELLVQITRRDLLLRYKQTIMGFGWAIFMPVVNTAVFSIIFTRVAPIDTTVPYPVFAFCGLLFWNFTASALKFAVVSLTSNTNLVTKVFFPREILPFSAVIVALVDTAVGALVLAALMVWYGIPITPAILLVPVILLVQVLFTAGLALLLAIGNLMFRDIKYLFDVVIAVWMFATSVLYPTTLITGKLRIFLQLNPLTPIIDAYRSVILDGRVPDPLPLAGAAAIAVVLFAGGWLLFHQAEFRTAENV